MVKDGEGGVSEGVEEEAAADKDVRGEWGRRDGGEGEGGLGPNNNTKV